MSLTQKKKSLWDTFLLELIPSSVFSYMSSYVLAKHHSRENTQQLFGDIKPA